MGIARKKPQLGEDSTGRDELNIAEFPVALLGKRPPGNAKTLHFEDQVYDKSIGEYVTRKLTITGSDLLGLPTQFDDEVLLACIQLSKEQGFRDRKVEFTRYDLLRLLGRKVSGRSYQRVGESLDRWAGTLFISDKAWWDKESQCWVKDTFNVIDRVNLVEQEDIDRRRRLGGDGPKSSSFLWGDFMWRSFQAGNLKELDYEFWKSLRHAASKRLYRILDKRFYHRSVVTFDLHSLAYDKIGLSRSMHTGQIKEKLRPANEELEERGVCHGEFVQKERGKWEVVYTKQGKQLTVTEPAADASPVVAALEARGVSPRKAIQLAAEYPEERIRQKLQLFDWHSKQGQAKQAGFLVKAIEDDYAVPEELSRKAGTRRASRRQAEPAQAPAAVETSGDPRIEEFLAGLTAGERERLEQEALAAAAPFIQAKLRSYEQESSSRYDALRRSVLERFVAEQLEAELATAAAG